MWVQGGLTLHPHPSVIKLLQLFTGPFTCFKAQRGSNSPPSWGCAITNWTRKIFSFWLPLNFSWGLLPLVPKYELHEIGVWQSSTTNRLQAKLAWTPSWLQRNFLHNRLDGASEKALAATIVAFFDFSGVSSMLAAVCRWVNSTEPYTSD